MDALRRAVEHPPVVEAVAGIEFRARGMDVIALARESQQWASDYPNVSAQPPLLATQPIGQPGLDFDFQLGQGLRFFACGRLRRTRHG